MMSSNEDVSEGEWTDDSQDRYHRPITRDERPTEAVVTAVSTATGRSPLELAPLYGVVDPDALDSLCCDESGVSTVFLYEGCEVSLDPDAVYVRKLK